MIDEMDVKRRLAANVRAERARVRMSQVAVAEAAALLTGGRWTESRIRRIEGDGNVSGFELFVLSHILRAPMPSLFPAPDMTPVPHT